MNIARIVHGTQNTNEILRLRHNCFYLHKVKRIEIFVIQFDKLNEILQEKLEISLHMGEI